MIPAKPNIPATIATTKKISAQRNIETSQVTYCFDSLANLTSGQTRKAPTESPAPSLRRRLGNNPNFGCEATPERYPPVPPTERSLK
jgi:hypothetical protein